MRPRHEGTLCGLLLLSAYYVTECSYVVVDNAHGHADEENVLGLLVDSLFPT
jgi:hypothetical protein